MIFWDLLPSISFLSWDLLKVIKIFILCHPLIILVVLNFLAYWESTYILFSAYYIIFQSFNNPDPESRHPMPTPVESVIAIFIMSLGSFANIWNGSSDTHHPLSGKVSFVGYWAILKGRIKKIMQGIVKYQVCYTAVKVFATCKWQFVLHNAHYCHKQSKI